MGSSVFHGGFSTFLAIVALAPAKSWIFMVFFKLWFGIIVFGMANGFLLLPVLLTMFGPTETFADPNDHMPDEDMLIKAIKDADKAEKLGGKKVKSGAIQPIQGTPRKTDDVEASMKNLKTSEGKDMTSNRNMLEKDDPNTQGIEMKAKRKPIVGGSEKSAGGIL